MILSLSVTSSMTISAPNYASAQVSGQNATTTGGDSATTTNINATSSTAAGGENQSISEVQGVGGAGEQNK
jgi:hypothetical protein